VTRGSVGLLDTSVVIQLERLEDVRALPSEPLISAITLAELSVGPLVAPPDRHSAHLRHVQTVESGEDPLPLDARAARAFGHVAASLRRRGLGVVAVAVPSSDG
jgi:tRNA(fMet)-specific endonuclease VapC